MRNLFQWFRFRSAQRRERKAVQLARGRHREALSKTQDHYRKVTMTDAAGHRQPETKP